MVREVRPVRQVIVLSLSDDPADAAGGCCGDAVCGADGASDDGPTGGVACATRPARVPVLACSDALSAGGAAVEVVTASSDADIDAALKAVRAGEADLVVAASADAQIRAVLRRMVRAYAPKPSARPAGLPADRTVPALPPIGILPLTP